MKISMFTSSKGWGGLERNLVVMARWMAEAGHAVQLGAHPQSPVARQAPDLLPPDTVHAVATPRQLTRWVGNSDLLWIRDPRDLRAAAAVSRRTGVPLVVQQAMQLATPKTKPWHKRRYAMVAAWVSGLEWLATQAAAHTPLPPSRCHVIPLPLEASWFGPKPQARDALRTRLGLPTDTALVGTVGRLDPGKGQRVLLESLPLLPEHVHAVWVGSNTVDTGVDERAWLENRALELGLASRIHWVPETSNVRDHVDCLDVFAMTSKAETIGTVTLEAMARRVPVVGSRSGGTAELLGHDRGLLFTPESPSDLAEKVRTALDMGDGARQAMGDRAEMWAQKSRAEFVVPAWNNLLASVAREGRTA